MVPESSPLEEETDIKRPTKVTETSDKPGRVDPIVVRTKDDDVEEETTPATPPLMKTDVTELFLKNPNGYVSVMVLLVASAPPAVVVNENVAAAGVLPATRSDVAIANKALVT